MDTLTLAYGLIAVGLVLMAAELFLPTHGILFGLGLAAALIGVILSFGVSFSTGVTTLINTNALVQDVAPSALTVDPSGKFLYVTNEDSDNMSVFSINAGSGVLTAVTGSPFATNLGSEGVTITRK